MTKTIAPTAKCRKCNRTLRPSNDGRIGRVDFDTKWVTRRGQTESRECREGGTHDAVVSAQ